jgi:hypothetical protein
MFFFLNQQKHFQKFIVKENHKNTQRYINTASFVIVQSWHQRPMAHTCNLGRQRSGGLQFEGSLGKIAHETPSRKHPNTKKSGLVE